MTFKVLMLVSVLCLIGAIFLCLMHSWCCLCLVHRTFGAVVCPVSKRTLSAVVCPVSNRTLSAVVCPVSYRTLSAVVCPVPNRTLGAVSCS